LLNGLKPLWKKRKPKVDALFIVDEGTGFHYKKTLSYGLTLYVWSPIVVVDTDVTTSAPRVE
jgi:hypothetical protein